MGYIKTLSHHPLLRDLSQYLEPRIDNATPQKWRQIRWQQLNYRVVFVNSNLGKIFCMIAKHSVCASVWTSVGLRFFLLPCSRSSAQIPSQLEAGRSSQTNTPNLCWNDQQSRSPSHTKPSYTTATHRETHHQHHIYCAQHCKQEGGGGRVWGAVPVGDDDVGLSVSRIRTVIPECLTFQLFDLWALETQTQAVHTHTNTLLDVISVPSMFRFQCFFLAPPEHQLLFLLLQTTYDVFESMQGFQIETDKLIFVSALQSTVAKLSWSVLIIIKQVVVRGFSRRRTVKLTRKYNWHPQVNDRKYTGNKTMLLYWDRDSTANITNLPSRPPRHLSLCSSSLTFISSLILFCSVISPSSSVYCSFFFFKEICKYLLSYPSYRFHILSLMQQSGCEHVSHLDNLNKCTPALNTNTHTKKIQNCPTYTWTESFCWCSAPIWKRTTEDCVHVHLGWFSSLFSWLTWGFAKIYYRSFIKKGRISPQTNYFLIFCAW